jgi:hypothetical protein
MIRTVPNPERPRSAIAAAMRSGAVMVGSFSQNPMVWSKLRIFVIVAPFGLSSGLYGNPNSSLFNTQFRTSFAKQREFPLATQKTNG